MEKYELNPFTLTFRKRRLEQIFLRDHVEKSLFQSRLAVSLGLLMYTAFAVLDYVLLGPAALPLIILIRLVVVPAIFVMALIFTFTLIPYLEWIITFTLLAAQAGHMALFILGTRSTVYFFGVTTIILLFLLTFSRIRFRNASILSLVLVSTFGLCVALFGASSFYETLMGSFFLGSLTVVGGLAGYSMERYIRQDFVRGRELDEERLKSDRLLLNILPFEVAKELKEKGLTLPVRFERVSVMFTDFVQFSRHSAGAEPSQVVSSLDRYFSAFDTIVSYYKLEKIKTIGDAYMVASGLPVSRPTHAVDCVLAAMDFLEEVKRLADNPEEGFLHMDIRVGIHIGPVVAGVLGKQKFTYDIFGPTVNVASRMESSGATNRVNISREVYEAVKDYFLCSSRGIVGYKNDQEGEMFFVERIHPELSLDPEGTLPGPGFVKLYEKLEAQETV